MNTDEKNTKNNDNQNDDAQDALVRTQERDATVASAEVQEKHEELSEEAVDAVTGGARPWQITQHSKMVEYA